MSRDKPATGLAEAMDVGQEKPPTDGAAHRLGADNAGKARRPHQANIGNIRQRVAVGGRPRTSPIELLQTPFMWTLSSMTPRSQRPAACATEFRAPIAAPSAITARADLPTPPAASRERSRADSRRAADRSRSGSAGEWLGQSAPAPCNPLRAPRGYWRPSGSS